MKNILPIFFAIVYLSGYSQALLPVEVLGTNGTTDSRDFPLNNVSEVKFLYLLVNNFTHEGKVQVRINNESIWTSLNSSNSFSDKQGAAFGYIGGGYSTLKVFVDLQITENRRVLDALINGTNTIHFRYNATNDTKTIGYRIVKFNFLRSNSTPIIPETAFVQDEPSDWKPIYSDQASINAGRDLWFNKEIKDSPSNPVILRAKCTHCHASDGEDLKYYNFSNKSIIERSKFHGVTELEAEQIASYIRTLTSPTAITARVWNPPFQPGPTVDTRPGTGWPAGLGLDFVLDDDSEMLPYLFPNGTSDSELEKVFDLKETLNIREIPVAIQFPDWNDWLPEIHPLDMMSQQAYQSLINGVGGISSQRNSGTYGYQKVKEALEKNGVNSYNNGNGKNLQTLLSELGAGAQDFLFKDYIDSSGGLFWWTIKDSPGIRERKEGMLVETFKKNIAKWNAVKHWEIMQRYNITRIKPRNVPYAEHRQWPTNNWTVFAIAPHISADVRANSRFEGQSANVGYYESTVWYQLQITLNAGMRIPIDVAPVDWSYNFDHITKSSSLTVTNKEPLRFIQNFIKAYQQRDNQVVNNNNPLVNNSAWNMREVSPWRLYSTAKGNTTLHEHLNSYEEGLRAKLASKLLKMFNDKAAELSEDNWPRANDGNWYKLETSSYIPFDNSRNNCLFPNPGGGCDDIQNVVEANSIYILIPLLQSININCNEVERLRLWAKDMWPLGNWDQYINNSCTLGIDNLTINKNFTIYPNPTKGVLKLSKLINWTVFDVLGKTLKSGYSQEVDLTYLPNTMYILKTPEGIFKVIKSN